MSERRAAVRSCGRPVVVVLFLVVIYGCAPRVEVIDAVSGQPVAAQVRELANGSLLVEANGYETWSGPARQSVALRPLWQVRFMERGEYQRQPAPPCASCPGR